MLNELTHKYNTNTMAAIEMWVLVCFVGFVGFVTSVDVLDVGISQTEKECYGSNMGFSFSGTHEYHYESLRRRYTGCTYVQGNLEITNLFNGNVTYDLGFLSNIKIVTGYVLFGLLNVETIPLTSLRLIRADRTLRLGRKRYALVVALTSVGTPTEDNPTPGLKRLLMPRLREVSQGKVLFSQNPMLCFAHTIDWSVIASGQVINKDGQTDKPHCGKCSRECADVDGVTHCWASGRHMCQHAVERIECDSVCPGRCFHEGADGCCHKECVIGCWDTPDTECMMCKHFRHGYRCVSMCPEGTYPMAQECIEF